MSDSGPLEYRIGKLERDLQAESNFSGCLWLVVFIMAVGFAICELQYDEHLKAIGHPLTESTWDYFKRKVISKKTEMEK